MQMYYSLTIVIYFQYINLQLQGATIDWINEFVYGNWNFDGFKCVLKYILHGSMGVEYEYDDDDDYDINIIDHRYLIL